MHIWTNVTAAAEATPSPLLVHIAGPFADRIALIWPAPHAPFVTAGAAQRHLIAIGLSHGAEDVDLRAVLETPIKRSLRAILPMAPNGLPRALGRLGETLWTPDDYGLLLAALVRPETAKALAHAREITPGLVRRLHRLPTPLVLASVVGMDMTPDQSALIAEIFLAIEARDGPAAARRAADRWARAKGLEGLVERVRDDLTPELPTPPFPGGARLRPITCKAEVAEVARRFNNCLRGQASRAADGSVAFYEWSGPPPAVVEILLDPVFGWRLDEVKLKDNETMSEADRPALIADLRAMGVSVSRTSWELNNALRGVRSQDFRLTPINEAIGWRFEN